MAAVLKPDKEGSIEARGANERKGPPIYNGWPRKVGKGRMRAHVKHPLSRLQVEEMLGAHMQAVIPFTPSFTQEQLEYPEKPSVIRGAEPAPNILVRR